MSEEPRLLPDLSSLLGGAGGYAEQTEFMNTMKVTGGRIEIRTRVVFVADDPREQKP